MPHLGCGGPSKRSLLGFVVRTFGTDTVDNDGLIHRFTGADHRFAYSTDFNGHVTFLPTVTTPTTMYRRAITPNKPTSTELTNVALVHD